jgi:hypothetical protein
VDGSARDQQAAAGGEDSHEPNPVDEMHPAIPLFDRVPDARSLGGHRLFRARA